MSAPDKQCCDQSGYGNCDVPASEVNDWIVNQLKIIIPGQDELSDSILIKSSRGLLKIYTPDGLFYFKALQDVHAHEQKLTCLLAKLYPANFPEVICVDNKRRWLLMREVKGKLLDEVYEAKYFEEAIYSFAKIQIDCIKRANELLACGCPDYRLESILLNTRSFFEELSIWETGNKESDNIRKQFNFPMLVEQMIERAELIKEEDIPPTLCHGDLNLGNMFSKHDQYVFIDWAEGYIGYPFFTLLEYLSLVKRDRGIEIVNIPALRTAYLKPWSDILQIDISHLTKLLNLSRPLGMLRFAMRLKQYYGDLESIRKAPEISAAYITRVWNQVKRINKVFGNGSV